VIAPEATAERWADVRFRYAEREFVLVGPEGRSHALSECERSGTFYALEMLEDMRGRLAPGDLVLDVGAHIGTHSVYLAAVCACRVIAFEPHPEAFAALCENVRRNGVSARVEARCCAVGADDGFATLEETTDLGETRAIASRSASELSPATLGGLSPPRRAAALKIDIDGGGLDFLRGALGLLRASRPLVYGEVVEQDRYEEVSDLLAVEGYRLVASFNKTPTMLFAHEADARVAADAQTLARSFGSTVMKAYRAELACRAERRRAADLAAELEQAKLRLSVLSARCQADTEKVKRLKRSPILRGGAHVLHPNLVLHGARGLLRGAAFDLRNRRGKLRSYRLNVKPEDRVALAKMESRFLISVIMPVHDHAGTVSAAAGSILAQSYRNVELIAVDDASKDGSFEELVRLARADRRVRVFRLPRPRGREFSLNFGLGKVRGKHIAFQHPATVAAPDRIAYQLSRVFGDGAVATLLRPKHRSPTQWGCLSDLLFACDPVFTTLGFLDRVAPVALEEYRLRIENFFGTSTIAYVTRGMVEALVVGDRLEMPELEVIRGGERYLEAAASRGKEQNRDNWAGVFREFPTEGLKERLPQPLRRQVSKEDRAAVLVSGQSTGEALGLATKLAAQGCLVELFCNGADPALEVSGVRPWLARAAPESESELDIRFFAESEPGAPFMPPATAIDAARHRVIGIAQAPAPLTRLPADTPLKVSVILPTCNRASTLGASIDSVLEQTYTNLELIVVDDASSDSTAAVVAGCARADSRVKPIRLTSNRGTYWARNIGLQHATGDLVTIQDDDDLSLAHRLELTVAALRARPDAVAAIAEYVRRDPLGRPVIMDGVVVRALGLHTLMVRRSFLDERLGFYDVVRVSGDIEFCKRLVAAAGPERLLRIPDLYYHARLAPGSLITSGIGRMDLSRARAEQRLPRIRQAYQKAFEHWHAEIAAGRCPAYLPFPPKDPRPFAAPRELLADPGSRRYWEERYAGGGNSGAGSYGKFAEFKAEVLNAFVAENHIDTVIEFGCGDGNQLLLTNYPKYMGVDVSATAINVCKSKFRADHSKSFKTLELYAGETADLVLSLDVIYHLVQDVEYEKYMTTICAAATKYMIIYSSNTNEAYQKHSHIRHRKFTEWIETNADAWSLEQYIPNRYPYTDDHQQDSFADFYIYRKTIRNGPIYRPVAQLADEAP
jgi:FkbM family methyltransferase